MKHKIMLIDGMALLFRGFYATAYRGNFMKTKKGVPTNAVYQFLRYLLNAREKFNPTHVICCWDMGSKTFRTTLYPAYKANRSEPPEELIRQFDLVKEVTAAFHIPNVGVKDMEADDCIGTLAKQYSIENEVLIVTGDQDILQLVADNIDVAIMKKGQGNYELFTNNTFVEKKGLTPAQIIDLKGLMGDSSDNYPGVKGIGEKTAAKLLQQYETIDQLLEKMDELPKGTQRKIRENRHMLHLSRQLATIKCDVPIECNLEGAKWDYDRQVLRDKLNELEFTRLTELV